MVVETGRTRRRDRSSAQEAARSGSTSSSCSRATARSTKPRAGLSDTTLRWPHCPAGRPTCSRARSAIAARSDRGGRRSCSGRSRRDRSAGSAWAQPRARRPTLVPVPPRRSASTPPSCQEMERASVAEAIPRAPGVRDRGRRHLAAPLRPRHAIRVAYRDDGTRRRRGPVRDRLELGSVHVRRCDAGSRVAPSAGLDRPLAVTILREPRATLVVRAALSGLATGALRRERRPTSCSAPTSTGCTIDADRPFPWQVDGDYLGRRRSARRPLRARLAHDRHA